LAQSVQSYSVEFCCHPRDLGASTVSGTILPRLGDGLSQPTLKREHTQIRFICWLYRLQKVIDTPQVSII
jgi:hypothetical protein